MSCLTGFRHFGFAIVAHVTKQPTVRQQIASVWIEFGDPFKVVRGIACAAGQQQIIIDICFRATPLRQLSLAVSSK